MAKKSRTGLFLGLVWLAVAAIAGPGLLAAAATPAQAQENTQVRRGGGLFDMLFRSRPRTVEPEAPPQRRTTTRNRPRAASGDAAPTARAAPKQSVEKTEDARTVLVVGDFMAGGLAEGLDEAFAQTAGIRIVSRANGSSGFVRDDYYDWPGEIGAILEQEKPAAVLVMIGSNDRQQMTLGGTRESVRSEAWSKEYEARAKRLAQTIRQSGAPLLWVGMPAFKVGSMSTDMVAFNDVYRSVAEEVGGEFIDIWDGFVDENGAFVTIGPDINGQRVRLRGSDGINLSRAGKRKVAFYTEKSLNRLLGGAVQPGIAAVAPGVVAPPVELDPAEISRTPPIALSDPELDGSADLLGAHVVANRKKPGIPSDQLVRDGAAANRAGRADDFSSAVPAAAIPAAVVPPPASPETTSTIAD